MESQQAFGEWLRQTRESRGIKQNELSQLIAHLGKGYSYDQSHISKIERGMSPATHEFCIAFALAVNMPINFVLYQAGLVGEEALREEEVDTAAQEFRSRLNQFQDPEDRDRAVRVVLTLLDALAKDARRVRYEAGHPSSKPTRRASAS